MQDLNALIPFLTNNTRSVRIITGYDPGKSSVSSTEVGDSIFKGIERATAARPLENISMGLVAVEVESREHDIMRFTDTTIEGAARKAAEWVSEKRLDEGG